MASSSTDKTELWAVIVSCGLEEEFERDWFGRVKHKRTRLVLRADMTPDLVRMLAGAKSLIADAQGGLAGVALAAREKIVERLLANAEKQ